LPSTPSLFLFPPIFPRFDGCLGVGAFRIVVFRCSINRIAAAAISVDFLHCFCLDSFPVISCCSLAPSPAPNFLPRLIAHLRRRSPGSKVRFCVFPLPGSTIASPSLYPGPGFVQVGSRALGSLVCCFPLPRGLMKEESLRERKEPSTWRSPRFLLSPPLYGRAAVLFLPLPTFFVVCLSFRPSPRYLRKQQRGRPWPLSTFPGGREVPNSPVLGSCHVRFTPPAPAPALMPFYASIAQAVLLGSRGMTVAHYVSYPFETGIFAGEMEPIACHFADRRMELPLGPPSAFSQK